MGGGARWAWNVPPALRRLINGASLVMAGTMVGQVSNFAFNAVGAHSLGPVGYGSLAASMALLSFAAPMLAAVQTVASRGTTSLVLLQQTRSLRPMLAHYGLRLAVGSLALGGAIALASVWISRMFHLGSPWLVVTIGAIIPCYLIGHLLGGLLQGAERFGRFAAESVAEGLTKAIVGVLAMGFLWRSALAGLTAVAGSSAVALVSYLLLTLPAMAQGTLVPTPEDSSGAALGRLSHRRRPRRGMPGVIGYSMTALCTYGLLALMLSSDTLVAKHYLPDYQAGLYAGASLTGKIVFFAASSFFVIAFPVFSRHHDEGRGGTRWILGACGIVSAISWSIVALFALEPSWIVIPLLGSRYWEADRFVPLLAAVFGLYALGYLLSIYLLARKHRGVIAVLALAVMVQFAGYYSFHAGMSQLIAVLAAAFAVMVAGGIVLVMFTRVQQVRPRAPSATPFPRDAWREQIVTGITGRVGPAPVLLGGSRALGTAHEGSDYDIAVVLPLPRIPRAAPRLAEAARCLSADLGVEVSVNPVPRFRIRRPGGSLFARKLKAEAVILAAPPGWSLRREPLTGVTAFAASSALLSAARSVLEAFDPAAMRGGRAPVRGHDALRKAALHVAQVRLLRSGCYASGLESALTQLQDIQPSRAGELPGAKLAIALRSALGAQDMIEGFLSMRECIVGQLAEIADVPLRMPIGKSLIRNAQYAALARLRGRSRWRVALRWTAVETALAATQVALLRALDPNSSDGLNATHLRLAVEALPPGLAGQDLRWEDVRNVALAEWLDAHPLVGVLA